VTRRQQMKTRKERNQELARLDAANRCAYCKAPLVGVKAQMRWGSDERYCSQECLCSGFARVQDS